MPENMPRPSPWVLIPPPVWALFFVLSAWWIGALLNLPPAARIPLVLVTSGPFRYTRNPMYLGILVAITGIAFIVGTLASFCAVVVFFLFVNFVSIPYEEEKMERQFGDDYRAYKAKVRRWI